MDSQFEGPFGIRFGLDPLIGLVPVVGDFLTSLVSFYIIFEAYRLGCGILILSRMLLNVFMEDIVAIVPFVGQLFDFYWKANNKNMILLEKFLLNPKQTQKKSGLLLILLIATILILLISTVVLSVYTIKILLRLS